MPKDYNNTVNLPKTDFPMRAGLPNREPGMLETFQKKSLYSKLRKTRACPSSFCTTAPPMPTAISISARRSTRF